MIVVSNASPIISLERIGQIELLNKLFTKVLIPEQVHAELTPPPHAAITPEWLNIEQLSDTKQLEEWRTKFRLGKGELATILLAKELSANLAIIDERKARQLAIKENLKVVGAVGILEESYRRNLIHDLRACYQNLLSSGTYIERRLLNASLQTFGLSQLK